MFGRILNDMYLNPALVMMFIAMLMAFIAVGGLIWKAADKFGRLDVRIARIETKLSLSPDDAKTESRQPSARSPKAAQRAT